VLKSLRRLIGGPSILYHRGEKKKKKKKNRGRKEDEERSAQVSHRSLPINFFLKSLVQPTHDIPLDVSVRGKGKKRKPNSPRSSISERRQEHPKRDQSDRHNPEPYNPFPPNPRPHPGSQPRRRPRHAYRVGDGLGEDEVEDGAGDAGRREMGGEVVVNEELAGHEEEGEVVACPGEEKEESVGVEAGAVVWMDWEEQAGGRGKRSREGEKETGEDEMWMVSSPRPLISGGGRAKREEKKRTILNRLNPSSPCQQIRPHDPHKHTHP
jgi:hypothetical protein